MDAYVFLLVVYLSNGSADVSEVSYPTIEACAKKAHARLVQDMSITYGSAGKWAESFQCLPMPKRVSVSHTVCLDPHGLRTCSCTLGIPEVCDCPCANERTDPPEYPLAPVPVPDRPGPETQPDESVETREPPAAVSRHRDPSP